MSLLTVDGKFVNPRHTAKFFATSLRPLASHPAMNWSCPAGVLSSRPPPPQCPSLLLSLCGHNHRVFLERARPQFFFLHLSFKHQLLRHPKWQPVSSIDNYIPTIICSKIMLYVRVKVFFSTSILLRCNLPLSFIFKTSKKWIFKYVCWNYEVNLVMLFQRLRVKIKLCLFVKF